MVVVMAAHQEGEALIVPTSGLGGVDQIGTAPPTTAVLYRQHLKVRISDNLTCQGGELKTPQTYLFIPAVLFVRSFYVIIEYIESYIESIQRIMKTDNFMLLITF